MKKETLLTLTFALFASAAIPASADPVITTETKLDKKGKKVAYMFIDGIKVHETDPEKQPQPKVVTPKPYDAKAAKAPADAKILFDGSEKSYQNWTDTKGGATKWKLVDGALESVRRSGYIQSKEKFGSCKLHIEFATPSTVKGNGQGRQSQHGWGRAFEREVCASRQQASKPHEARGRRHTHSPTTVLE